MVVVGWLALFTWNPSPPWARWTIGAGAALAALAAAWRHLGGRLPASQQALQARHSLEACDQELRHGGAGEIVTEIDHPEALVRTPTAVRLATLHVIS